MKKKILIVDDADFMQEDMSAMLSDHYETICASSGEEALELCGQKDPDLILMDLEMPNMTGLDLQKALKARHHDEIPIVFMSADENDESEIQGLQGGAMDFIHKPFKKDVLLHRVANVIEHMEHIRSLQMAAEMDPMTGLYNKASAEKHLTKLCRHATGVLMMVDLDSFKLVNDLHGHDMGDRILIRFAEILRSVNRNSDLVGRMGGDEFVVFCQDVRDEPLVAEKSRQMNELVHAAAVEMMGEDTKIPLGVSLGVVRVPDEGTDFHALYKMADKALYQVKQGGKHGYSIFRGAMSRLGGGPSQGRGSSVENLRAILEERNRQPGAYELGFENFRSIFRYMVRSIENYHRPVELINFSLKPDKTRRNGMSEDEMFEKFKEILLKSLRRSDVFMESGRGQYMVLLTETGSENEETILNRVLGKWEAKGGSRADVACETSVIDS